MPDLRFSRAAASKQAIRIRQLYKTYDAHKEKIAALENLSCDIAEGEFAVILGPSGCGKSTLVRIIAGLEQPSSGTILVNGSRDSAPGKTCSMVFQSYTSFPWLSVLDNIAFAMRYTSTKTKHERRTRAQELARMVGLENFENAWINELSGGMKQRVSIASALATESRILIMDEPFGALDSQTRMAMQEQLLTITEKTGKTVVFVTHDIEEALVLGDRIYVCTSRPARILAEMDVALPRPRTPEMRNRKIFVEMKYEIFHLLRDHVYAQILETHRARR
ncbi:MAG: ABC transporter ATP-binding protein [Acidobacteriaceae bacterium]|nr:ABC transporter ATP-binding protein [Acidobacteriaceae bacterium]MBV9295916.1 ABC transporter ATP-binding protein [Acidobacteriaceae bacterium]MBV9765801.1 ABC transporter ATP-binding protein [Acidobacteriaceae bacterium]